MKCHIRQLTDVALFLQAHVIPRCSDLLKINCEQLSLVRTDTIPESMIWCMTCGKCKVTACANGQGRLAFVRNDTCEVTGLIWDQVCVMLFEHPPTYMGKACDEWYHCDRLVAPAGLGSLGPTVSPPATGPTQQEYPIKLASTLALTVMRIYVAFVVAVAVATESNVIFWRSFDAYLAVSNSLVCLCDRSTVTGHSRSVVERIPFGAYGVEFVAL
jgi:hypothetical protein